MRLKRFSRKNQKTSNTIKFGAICYVSLGLTAYLTGATNASFTDSEEVTTEIVAVIPEELIPLVVDPIAEQVETVGDPIEEAQNPQDDESLTEELKDETPASSDAEEPPEQQAEEAPSVVSEPEPATEQQAEEAPSTVSEPEPATEQQVEEAPSVVSEPALATDASSSPTPTVEAAEVTLGENQ